MEILEIGTILKPQGVKGELKVKITTSTPEVFDKIEKVYIDSKEYYVVSSIVRFGYAYVLLEGLCDRNGVEHLRNKSIYIDKSQMDLERGTYFIADLIGSTVVDEHNNTIGTLLDIEQFGSADVLVIEQYKREYRVPYIDNIVKEVRIDEKLIIVYKDVYDEVKICE